MGTGHIVIIGASAAGIAAVKAIRQTNQNIEITMISEEQDYPYFRPFLTEYLADPCVTSKPNFYLNPVEWYAQNQIQLLLGEKAVGIDLSNKTVSTDQQRRVNYDKLILAVGSKPFVPMPGILDKENVFAIRTLPDAQRVEAYARTVKRLTVIGGGVLGLETADALLQKGLDITIIEYVNRILPMQLDEDGSQLFQALIEKQGINLKLNNTAQSFGGERRVTAITLKSGEDIPTEMVVFSIGVRANLELAQGCGLKTKRGVLVNAQMETSAPGVYACGDVAEYGKTTALWTVAMEQGVVAGRNAAGGEATFAYQNFPVRLESFGTRVYSVGDLGNAADPKDYITMRKESLADYLYKNLYFKDDALTGGILIGDIKKSSSLLKAVNAEASLMDALTLLK